MNSTRLPGKTLMDLHGQTVLSHVVQRASAIEGIDSVVVATTQNLEDIVILHESERLGVEGFAGSNEDVLDRIYKAAKRYSAGTVIRLTADCPLLDPCISTLVLKRYLQGGVDYVSNNHPPTYPDGLDTEVCSINALEMAWKNAVKNSDREHVTSYIWNNPTLFNIAHIESVRDMSDMRWTLDKEEDLMFLEKLMSFFPEDGSIPSISSIEKILSSNSTLLALNKDIIRNEGYIKSIRLDNK